MDRKLSSKGFTLAEVLLALAILGVIAVFTIPKVLISQQNSKKAAIMKEAISMMAQLTWEGTVTGELRPDTAADYYFSKINAVKACYDDPDGNSCWKTSQPAVGGTIESWQSAYILHNGAQIGGIQNSSAANPYWFFILDWNGEAGPNVEGDDQIMLGINFVDGGAPPYGYTGPSKKGTISPLDGYPVSQKMYEQLFGS